jgi:hypothetical protein
VGDRVTDVSSDRAPTDRTQRPATARTASVAARPPADARTVFANRRAADGTVDEVIDRLVFGPSEMRAGTAIAESTGRIRRSPVASPRVDPDSTGVPVIRVRQARSSPSRVVRRLATRAQFELKAGPPKADEKIFFGKITKRHGKRYKDVLARLDEYSVLSQNLWTTKAPAATFKKQLHDKLDELIDDIDDYLANHEDTGPRVSKINELRGEANSEKSKITTLTDNVDFATLDRTRAIDAPAERERGAVLNERPARLEDVGIAVDTEPRDGHGMAVWAEIDATDAMDPKTEGDTSVYGVTLEYWEAVDIEYDFPAARSTDAMWNRAHGVGAKRKQWNDVYAMAPTSVTFTNKAPPIDVSWGEAVGQSQLRKLRGRVKVGFRDPPAYWAEREGKKGRYGKRTLSFRIQFRDAFGRVKRMWAKQVVVLDGQSAAAYRTYVDSVGNKIGEERTHGGAEAMPADDPRVGEHGVDADNLTQDIPNAAYNAIPAFRAQLDNKTAQPFDYAERRQIKSHFDQTDAFAQQQQDKQAVPLGPKRKTVTGEEQYAIAGYNMLPFRGDLKYFEYKVPGSGLLVAAVYPDGRIWKVFFTTNVYRKVQTEKNALNVRQFAEIRVIDVIDDDDDQRTAPSNELITAFATKEAMVDFVRRNHGRFGEIKMAYEGYFPGKFYSHIGEVVAGEFARDGNSDAVYKRIRDSFPADGGLVRIGIDAPFKNANGEAALTRVVQAWTAGTALGTQIAGVGQNDGNALLALLQNNPNRITEIESTFRTIQPTVNFGQFVFDSFTARLTARKSRRQAVFDQLRQAHPNLDYLLYPAYRAAFGEAELQAVLAQARTRELARLVPGPTDPANLAAELAFRNAGPFTLTNFVPSTKMGRFDATYNPNTGVMDVTLRVAFEFSDATAKVKPGASPGLANQSWDALAKATYIIKMTAEAQNYWNSKFAIVCDRPGWTIPDVDVRLHMVEVTDDTEMWRIKVNKMVLDEKPGSKGEEKLTGTRSFVDEHAARAELQEYDVLDKLSDPLVHKYLHAAEIDQHINNSYKEDRARLQMVIDAAPSVTFRATEDTPRRPGDLAKLVEELKRLDDYSSFNKFHHIEVKGGLTAPEAPSMAKQRAKHVKTKIEPTRRSKRLVTLGAHDLGTREVSLTVLDDPSVKKKYVRLWRRISSAHEIGHMIGLDDEYIPAASTETVRRMISDGLLPPNTPADHLTGAGEGQGGHAANQEGFAKLLRKTGLPIPDFNPTKETPKSSSLMSAGGDVLASHYVTFWEALTKMTAPYLDEVFWRIQK